MQVIIIVAVEFSASVERADIEASGLVVVAVSDELPLDQEIHSSGFTISSASAANARLVSGD